MSFEIPVNFTYLQEPVDIWRKSGSLDLLYRKKITSSLFQMMVLATRSTSLFSTVSQLKKNRLNIIFTERSLKFGDRAFSNLYVTDQNELKMYNDCEANEFCGALASRDLHDPCIFDSAARDKYYPDRRLGFKPRGEVPLECETRPVDSSTPSRREAYYPERHLN